MDKIEKKNDEYNLYLLYYLLMVVCLCVIAWVMSLLLMMVILLNPGQLRFNPRWHLNQCNPLRLQVEVLNFLISLSIISLLLHIFISACLCAHANLISHYYPPNLISRGLALSLIALIKPIISQSIILILLLPPLPGSDLVQWTTLKLFLT